VAVQILVVDDYQPWLRFIHSMVQEAAHFEVIDEASDGPEALRKAAQLQPDLILLDIGLPMLNGIEVARQIRERSPKTKILFVSEQRSEDIVREALTTGSGYVVKSYAARELFPAMKAVLEGERFLSACLSGQILLDTKGEPAESNDGGTAEPRHEVNSYPDRATFVDGFARFVETSLKSGSAIVVLASESHRVGIIQKLKSEGVDVLAAIEQRRYLPLDIPDGFHTFRFAEHLATDAVKAARERNLHVGVG
jgi:DNA-binding NarL/FixJ family response regulator